MKKQLSLFVFFCCSLAAHSQVFYDPTTIQEIRITFTQSNWDALLDAAEASDAYIAAESVSINGTVFNNVGVKYKGNSSYNPNYAKNPFHIELDTYAEQNYQGYTDIKLNNVIFDPTFVRETTAYSIIRQYMHAPLSNYANVYVNNVLIGLYTNVESVSKKFVANHFGSNDNAFFDCSPPAGAGPGSTVLPNLAYLGTNSSSYEAGYDMKSDTGWDDLIALTNTLNNNIANIETHMDIDRAIWMLALDNVMVNLDSYIGQFKQNYYLYKDDSGRFNSIMWDLNMCFGTFSSTGSGNLTNITQKRQMSHTLHATEANWPLVQKLLAVPTFKKKYLAHYKTILTENFTNNSYFTTAQTYQSLISAAVAADTNKFYSTAQFTSNMTTDVSLGNNTASGLSNLMPGRVTYLSALSDFTATEPVIANIAPSVASPVLGTNVVITATITNATATSVYLGHRTNSFLPFTKVTLYDDGVHNDGAAGDNVFGNSIPVNGIATQYYIYAENTTIGKFSPARAEHEFYTLTASYPAVVAGDVTVNEIMSQNTTGATDEAGDFEDWVELYNTTSNDLNLAGHYLSDSTTNLVKWQFPLNSIIPSHGYMIIWADDEAAEGPLHASWKLSVGGESVSLSSPTQTIIDQIIFGAQTTNMAFARIPNGTGSFVVQAPTFNANNESLGTVQFTDLNSDLKLYPNPTSGILNLATTNRSIDTVQVVNLQGQVLYQNHYDSQSKVSVDLSDLSSGLYLVNVNNESTIKIFKN